jgi:hypothetical protein
VVLALSQAFSPGLPSAISLRPAPTGKSGSCLCRESVLPLLPLTISLSPKGRCFLEAGKSQGGRDLASHGEAGLGGHGHGVGVGLPAFRSLPPSLLQPSSLPSPTLPA